MNALSKPPAANQNVPADAASAGVNSISFNALRDKVARLERLGSSGIGGGNGKLRPVALGVPALDRHLPWGGLPRGALHEVAGEGGDREQGAAAAGFAALWLARLPQSGPV